MRVFVLGGYGKTGIAANKLLADSDLVTHITVAGRNLEKAQQAAAEVGRKAAAAQVDGADEDELTAASQGCDMLVNAASNEAVIPTIRAAIHNRAHYCDMAWAGILKEAMALGAEAEGAGITAILATGISPCISNLMGVQAAGQLDEVKQLQIGRGEIINFAKGTDPTPALWLEEPQDILAALQDYKAFIGWGLERMQKEGARSITAWKDNQWVEVNPIEDGLPVPLARGGYERAHPYFSGEDTWEMLPTDLAEVKPVEMWFSPFPPPLDAVLREQALGMLRGETEAEAAIDRFYKTMENDPGNWLTPAMDFSRMAKVWVRAVGSKDGRAAQVDCRFMAAMWHVGGYFLTSVALAAAVLMILRGQIQKRGVMTAEKAFAPQAFLDEVAALIPAYVPEGKLVESAFEWLG